MNTEEVTAELISVGERHHVCLEYRVVNWPDRENGKRRDPWTFRPEGARVNVMRKGQTEPWRVDNVHTWGQRILTGNRIGKQEAHRTYYLDRHEPVPPEVAELAAQALADVERERSTGEPFARPERRYLA